MALTGLEIFKLLPKTNCKKCGMPTCLAFAMQLAQKRAKLDDCPFASEQAKQTLAAAAEPPMRLVKFGTGDNQVQIGQETVMFRHEEKFHNPTILAVTVSDKLSETDLKKRVEAINALQFERVGLKIKVKAIAIINDSGSPETFASAAAAIVNSTDKFALILCSDVPTVMAAAVAKTAKSVPLIASATIETAEAMAKIAKENNCPIVAKASSIEALAELTEKIKAQGVNDIVLSLDGINLRDQLYGISKMRTLSLKKGFRALGYPILSFVEGDIDRQIAATTSLICKYAGIIVVDTAEPAAFLAMLTAIMNVYSDPQKPIQVESKIYTIGEPDENSPLMFTTNFSLTYYTVESDVEASRIPSYILVVDTEGTSVLTAYSGDKLNEKAVADAMVKNNVQNLVKHHKLIIPGYVAVMSGKLEEATGWEIMVGPRESSMIPKYLQEVWK
jgi:acetyl-CoA decarbonylase/synthase, CODH/ACS complex subunit gamma